MFPADQAADAAGSRRGGNQSRAISLTPDHPFGIGGHEFAMAMDQPALGVEDEQGIIERAAPCAFCYAFVNAHDKPDFVTPGNFGECFGGRAGNGDAVRDEARVNLFHGRVVPNGNVAAGIEPHRIAGQPGFAEGHNAGAATRGLGRELLRSFEGALEIEIRRGRLYCRYADCCHSWTSDSTRLASLTEDGTDFPRQLTNSSLEGIAGCRNLWRGHSCPRVLAIHVDHAVFERGSFDLC